MLDFLFLRPSQALSVPPDQLKVIFCLLSAYPLSSLYIRLPTGTARHVYSLAVAAFYLLGVLKLYGGVLHLLAASLGTYFIVCFDRRPGRMPWAVFAFTMSHLMFNHIYRTLHVISPDVIEITGSQMVLVMKLITFAWNVNDGRQDVSTLDAAQVATRLERIPSLHSFLGWAFFFPTILVGPSFDYSLYSSLVHNTLYLDPPTAKDPGDKKSIPKANPVGRKRVALTHMVVGTAFLGFYAVLGSKATYAGVLSDAWWSFSPVFRLLYVQACGFMARCKYYAVWELGEGAIILCGLGFNGYDSVTGRARWNRCRNVDALRLETSESFKTTFDNWNMRTSVWLRETVYKRVSAKGRKPGFKSTLFTFVTSAFWHGTQPGYYLTFLHGALFTSVSKTFRRNIRPLLLPPSSSDPNSHGLRFHLKRLYDVCGWLCVQLSLNYFASSFLLLDFRDCIEFFQRTLWYGDVALVVSFLFFQMGGARYLRVISSVPEPKPPLAVQPSSSTSISSAILNSRIDGPPSNEEDWELVKQEGGDAKGMGFGELGEKVIRRASVTE